jgi:pimeloyl-ACP methyl ester carboxylesterase
MPDGRMIRAREAGDPNGFPIFLHHGTPGAGLFYQPWVDDALERGARLVTYDRPGYGYSDRHEGRSVADAAADVAAIADHLEIERFASMGKSGGGEHALACGALLSDRVTAIATLAGAAPYDADGLDFLAGMGEDNVIEFGAAVNDRVELRRLLEQWRLEDLAADPRQKADTIASLISDVDRQALSGPLSGFFEEVDRLAYRTGVDGWFDDDVASVEPLGFEYDSITAPVLLLQGRHDLMVPFAHGEWLAQRIPNVEARMLEDEGHLSLTVNRIPETHEWLLAHSV